MGTGSSRSVDAPLDSQQPAKSVSTSGRNALIVVAGIAVLVALACVLVGRDWLRGFQLHRVFLLLAVLPGVAAIVNHFVTEACSNRNRSSRSRAYTSGVATMSQLTLYQTPQGRKWALS